MIMKSQAWECISQNSGCSFSRRIDCQEGLEVVEKTEKGVGEGGITDMSWRALLMAASC